MNATIVYHPAWQRTTWSPPARPGPDSDIRPLPAPLTWLALALAVAIAGVALGQLLIGAGLIVAPLGYLVGAVASSAGLGIASGMLGSEVLVWLVDLP